MESFKHIYGKYGIRVHFKGNTTIKQALMHPKDKDSRDNKSGVIYSLQCNNITCNEEYIGETARTLGERCKEHIKQPSPIYAHIQQTGHTTTDTSFNIIGWEDEGQVRTIKESIFIRINNPTLNQILLSTILATYGTEFFLRPQSLNWALPNSLAHNIIQGHIYSPALGI